MNLMKWLRKNNTKLMAIVVIVLMVAFIGGSSFRYLFRGSGGLKSAVAYFGHDQKITHLDLQTADTDIEIVSALRGDDLIRGQGMVGLLMSELLFRQNRSTDALEMARQEIQQRHFRISDQQLSEMADTHNVPGAMFWILLYNEAQTAGIRVSNEEAAHDLEGIIPQAFDKAPYRPVMQNMSNRFGVPEDRILAAFAKFLAIFQYAQLAAPTENLTTSQIKHMASSESEPLNAEFVQLKASYFANKDAAPSDEAVKEQFNKYKDNFPGQVSETNPYGFGYRLPDRIQFDYIVLKLADVASITKPPTEEEAEQYYQQNRERQYTQEVAKDPNDPNSPKVPQTKAYATVSDAIMKQLRRQRVVTRAEQLLQDAKNLADANLPSLAEGQEPTAEQRAEKAGDYTKIATKLTKTNGITFYSGRTGQLSAMNVQEDKYLRRMYLTTSGYNAIPLSQILFSVKELGDDATVLLSTTPMALYVSTPVAKDPMSAMASDFGDQIMMIARVVDVQKSVPPTDVDVTFSTRTLGLGGPEKKNQSFSVKEQVVNDLRAVAAWDATKNKAEEFKALATKDGWDKAVAQFNKLYGKQAKADPNDPNVFKVDHQPTLQRVSRAELQVLAAEVANSPVGPTVLNQMNNEGRFVEQLYRLIPAKGTTPPQMPLIVESKPQQSFYVLKSLTLTRLTQEDFQKMKGTIVRREDYTQIENLAAVHFNPGNVLKRMNFRFAHPTDQDTEGKTKQKSKGAS